MGWKNNDENNWKYARDSSEKDTPEDYVKRFWIPLTKIK